jgi:hypothetical protein
METIRYLRTIAQHELRIEHYRIELAVNDEFEPYQLYCIINDVLTKVHYLMNKA